MREIKFRAWIGYKMEYDLVVGRFGAFFVNPDENGDGRNPNDRACLSPLNTVLEHSPIMQYTGLKDKNGKEIYEGDVLLCDHYDDPKISVRWDISHGGWQFDHYVTFDDGVGLGNWDFTIGVAKNSEVIGNIYENPELITNP